MCSSHQGLPLQLYWQLRIVAHIHTPDHSQRKGLPDNPHKCPGSHTEVGGAKGWVYQ